MVDDSAGGPRRWNLPTVAAGGGVVGESRPGARSPFDPPAGARFVEGAELGRGGMGRVVEATDVALDRSVALKQVLTDSHLDHARFEREVRITARLEHPSIVPLLDAGRDAEGRPYYVMRKIAGQPLAALVAADTAVRARLALVPSVLAAIDATAYAHARGVIHRDIKPSNILVGEFGETLLIDWGLARELADAADDPADAGADDPADAGAISGPTSAADDGLTRAGHAYGTPGFMAPEQARGEPADRRADVYALGATLYFVLAGVAPYAGLGPTAAVYEVAAGAGADLSRVPAEVPRELVAIAVQAMAAAPADRYPDAAELAADLRRFLAGQLVAAHAYTVGQRVARFVRRHRVAVAVGALAVVAIAATSAVAVTRVVDERDAAVRARADALDRGDAELIGRARALLQIDPTAAVATLKQLRAGSAYAAHAIAIARAAVAAGVAHGYHAHTGVVTALALSPDGRALVSAGADGVVVLRELATGAARTLARFPGRVEAAVWLDARTIACATGARGLQLVDLGGAAPRQVAAEAEIVDLARGADGVLARTRDAVIAVAADGATRVVAERVRAWLVAGHTLVVSDGTDLRWIHDGQTHVLAAEVAATSGLLVAAVSPDGARIAADARGGIREWELVAGAPVERGGPWTLPIERGGYAHLLLYASGGLNALDWRKEWWRLEPGAERRRAVLPPAYAVAAVPEGHAFAGAAGEIAVTGPGGVVALGGRAFEVARMASAPGSRWLAAGTRAGDVLVWDLAAVRPQVVAAPSGLAFAVDDAAIWMSAQLDIVRIDRATGVQRTLPGGPAHEVMTGLADAVVVLDGLGARLVIYDQALVERAVVPDVVAAAAGSEGGREVVYTLDRTGELAARALATPGEARAIARVPGGARLALGGDGQVRWIAVAAPAEVTRIEVATGARAVIAAPGLDALVFDETGALWATSAGGLWRWDGARPPSTPIAVPRDAWIYALAGGGVITWTAGGVVLEVTADGRVGRRIQTEPARGRPVVSADRTAVAWATEGGLSVMDLATGVTRRLRGDAPRGIAIDPSGETVVASQHRDVGEGVVCVWRQASPAGVERGDGVALSAWLAQLTNAEVAPRSDAIEWR